MRKVFDKVETQIRSLENLDLDSKRSGSLFVPVLMSKLHDELKVFISRQFGKKHLKTFQKLRNFSQMNWRLEKKLKLKIT